MTTPACAASSSAAPVTKRLPLAAIRGICQSRHARTGLHYHGQVAEALNAIADCPSPDGGPDSGRLHRRRIGNRRRLRPAHLPAKSPFGAPINRPFDVPGVKWKACSAGRRRGDEGKTPEGRIPTAAEVSRERPGDACRPGPRSGRGKATPPPVVFAPAPARCRLASGAVDTPSSKMASR